MSGGHWDYKSYDLDGMGRKAGELWRLMSIIEHELDWGLSGDTCLECARNRVSYAIEEFFNGDCYDATTAIAVMKDREQHLCHKCK